MTVLFVLFLQFLYSLTYLHLTCHTLRPSLFSLERSFAYFSSPPLLLLLLHFMRWMQKFLYELLIFGM